MANLVTPKGRTMDYLQGQPDNLADEVVRLKGVAATIDQLTDLLGRIASGEGSQAQKIDTIREGAGEAKTALESARELYNKTGWALGEYQTQLRTSVDNAKMAYESASMLLPYVNASETAVHNAQLAYNKIVNGTPTQNPDLTAEENAAASDAKEQTALTALQNAQSLLDQREGNLHAYKLTWDTAKDDLDAAAEVARGRIQTAVDTSPGKDGDWDDFWAFVDGLADVLGWIILALTIVALFLSGPILAAVLITILVLSIVSLIAHVALLAANKGSWVDVGLDVVGLLPFGKLFTTAGKALPRITAFLKGIFDVSPPFKPRQIVEAREAVEAAIRANEVSMAGNVIQTRVDAVAHAINENGPGFIQTLLKGENETMAWYANILDDLPGYNQTAREAIETASRLVNDPGVAVDSVYNAVVEVATNINMGVNIYDGGDWVISSLVDLGTPDPTASDLKARILSPDTLVSAGATENPYD